MKLVTQVEEQEIMKEHLIKSIEEENNYKIFSQILQVNLQILKILLLMEVLLYQEII